MRSRPALHLLRANQISHVSLSRESPQNEKHARMDARDGIQQAARWIWERNMIRVLRVGAQGHFSEVQGEFRLQSVLLESSIPDSTLLTKCICW
jgi:hypothetical protein